MISRNSPELQYNKGVALKYEEDYSGALDCFARAQALDPTWDEPKNLERTLSKFLTDVKVQHATIHTSALQTLH